MKNFGSDRFDPESAGLEPGTLNPLAVEVMLDDGIDISKNHTKDVFDLFRQGKSFSYVITVCDAKSSDGCPIFPGMAKKINWDFEDPSKATVSSEEQLAQTRAVRNKIKEAVKNFIKEVTGG
jgi:arsenate reductase